MAGSGTTTWTLGLGSGFELSLVFGSVRGHCHTKASHTIHPEENQFEPKLVQSLLARVRSVHCGAYHTCTRAEHRCLVMRSFLESLLPCHRQDSTTRPNHRRLNAASHEHESFSQHSENSSSVV